MLVDVVVLDDEVTLFEELLVLVALVEDALEVEAEVEEEIAEDELLGE